MDLELLEELRLRLAERFTAAELIELLDPEVEDIIEMYLDAILARPDILEEVT